MNFICIFQVSAQDKITARGIKCINRQGTEGTLFFRLNPAVTGRQTVDTGISGQLPQAIIHTDVSLTAGDGTVVRRVIPAEHPGSQNRGARRGN
ncbi:Uncharacterised protein [Escherichia coli]|nr:Uncharacterised protein [Escherichia coli]CAD6115370.1 Uncharacterised protein [Escherichia coli]